MVGDLLLGRSTFQCVEDPGQKLAVWTADPGRPASDALRYLASTIGSAPLRT
ncbi:hypothetical protein [Streptomyces sp. NPDC050528]|uniref:hypothetical protein n=1 Tax=unclassified Streptomyces TaxID=2593676 RepID=UPI003797912B